MDTPVYCVRETYHHERCGALTSSAWIYGTLRIVTVAVIPDTSGNACGTSTIAMRTGTRQAYPGVHWIDVRQPLGARCRRDTHTAGHCRYVT